MTYTEDKDKIQTVNYKKQIEMEEIEQYSFKYNVIISKISHKANEIASVHSIKAVKGLTLKLRVLLKSNDKNTTQATKEKIK